MLNLCLDIAPQINADCLNINYLVEVQHAIWEGRTKWRPLGLELGLLPDTLKAIRSNHPQSVDECFCEMISEWLKSDYRPNWEILISALRSPIVGLHSLASKFEDRLGKVSALSLSLSLT